MTETGSRLLAGVAALSVPRRMAAIVQEARRLAGTPELDRILTELSGGDRYARLTAIQLAEVAGARNHLLAQLDSPDPECGVRALTAVIRVGVDPEFVVRRLPRMSQRARKALGRVLARGKHEALADALLPHVRELFGDAEAAQMLPNCSPATVAAALPELAYAVPSWGSLCRRHIGSVFEFVAARTERAALDEGAGRTEDAGRDEGSSRKDDAARDEGAGRAGDGRDEGAGRAGDGRAEGAGRDEWRELWAWLTADVSAAARHDPDRLLALAARAIDYVQIAALNPVVGMLARHDPEAVRRLILHPSGRGRGLTGSALWRAVRMLPDSELRELYTASAPHERHRFLRTLPPSRRAVIASELLMRPGIGPGDADMNTLDALPGPARATLARELLARPGGAEVPEVAEMLSARLSWAEAKPVLAEAIRRPTADERAEAYPLLVTAAAGSRDSAVVGELLELLVRLRNEQDPVRRTALHALTTIPVSLLAAEHLPALERLAVDALQARDRSHQTSATIGVLARTLLLRGAQTGDTAFADVALRITALLAETSTPLNLAGLHQNLPRGAEQRLFAALRSRLNDDAARDRWTLALELAYGLDRRAFGVPELQTLVLRACGAADDYTVRRAVRLALANPVTRDAHLDDMLRRDRSLIALGEVQELIARRRTDLLDTLLSKSTSGRFLSPKIRFVPMFYAGFDRWTTHHIDRYAQLLDTYANSPKASVRERAGAVRQLGRLPGSLPRLLPYLAADDLTVVEAALTALGQSDEPERAIAVLSEHVGDDRARVAVSGIAACARWVPPDRLGETLAPLLDSPKITAVKEGVRLVATLHAPDAMPIIRAVSARPGVHRDIRRATVFATRWLLDHDEAWQLLADAATDSEVASAILDITPPLLPIPQRRRFAAFLRDLAKNRDQRVASAALSALTRWYRWAPPDTRDVLVDRLTDLSEVGLWTMAMQVLVIDAGATGHPDALTTAVERLLNSADETLPGRDLPARQRLSTVIQWLGTAVRNNEDARPLAAPIIDLLAPDQLWHEQVIDLTLESIRWTEPDATLTALEALSPIAVGALGNYLASAVAARVGPLLDRIPAEALTRIASGLSTSPHPSSALTAADLIAQCGSRFGWIEPWPALLTDLRAHPDPDVRRTAHNAYTARE